MNRQSKKIIISVFVLLIAGGYLLYTFGRSALIYCTTVDDFIAGSGYTDTIAGKKADGKTYRLAGKLDNIQNGDGKSVILFDLTGNDKKIRVQYSGLLAPNFEQGLEAFVEGKLAQNGIFYADKVLTRCESKYKSKLNEKNSASQKGTN
jgi:cytochrome c-type biogenesis protein CcmE